MLQLHSRRRATAAEGSQGDPEGDTIIFHLLQLFLLFFLRDLPIEFVVYYSIRNSSISKTPLSSPTVCTV